MRILNVTESYAPFFEFGGPPVKVRALSEALARRGHEVTVLTADWGLESRLTGETQATAERSPFGWRVRENGVQTTYLPTWLHFRALSWNPAVNRYCRARLGNFDVVHIFGLYDLLGPAVASDCHRRNLPYVVEPIGMFVPIVRSFLLKRMYHFFLGQTMLSESGSVIATSAQEVAELESAGILTNKITLRRNGVDSPGEFPGRGGFRSAQNLSPDIKLILFLGRLSSKKSPDLLLKAFAALSTSKKRNDIALAFVGPDEAGMRQQLTRMAKGLRVESQVRFAGPLFGNAKWAAYRDADVFVLPSQNENFGNTAAEAATAGTPVIVTEACGIAPILKDRAGLVVRHDVSALSDAIERVLDEPQLHSRLAQGCADVAAELRWEEPACQMESIYNELVPRGSRVA
jgi:glycosyltransferase involved in cell wall biosynthesis